MLLFLNRSQLPQLWWHRESPLLWRCTESLACCCCYRESPFLPLPFGKDMLQYNILLIHLSNTSCKLTCNLSEYAHDPTILLNKLAILQWCRSTLTITSCHFTHYPLQQSITDSILFCCYLFLYSGSIQDMNISFNCRIASAPESQR